MLITKAKFKAGKHTSYAYGYDIVATSCKNRNQGGIALLVWRSKEWHVEDVTNFGLNVIKCTLVYGNKRNTIIGIYIPPSEDDLSTVKNLDLALETEDWGNTIVLGDLNISYSNPKDE